MRVLFIIVFTLVLTSCSSMSGFGVLKKAVGLGGAASGGIDVDTNIGKEIKDEDNVVKIVGETSDIKADSITGGINKTEGNTIKADKIEGGLSFTTIQSMPLEMQLLMILGWIAPSPSNIWRGFLNMLPWRKKNEHS